MGVVQINICLQYLNYYKKCSYSLILIHCKVDACKNDMFFEIGDEERNIDSSLCVICQKDKDTDG